MRELQTLEQFEMEALNALNRIRVSGRMHFGGGTMLRLCHGLNRYSTDLDFWLKPEEDAALLFRKIRDAFSESFSLRDAENKRDTLLFEIQTQRNRRSLKIEIRKNQTGFRSEKKIAFSRYSNLQVAVRGLTLEQMMINKIAALSSRKLIRDAFDIEFLLMRGVALKAKVSELEKMIKILDGFTPKDYKVTLRSLLEPEDRALSMTGRFHLLREEINRNRAEADKKG
jgi:predicted nucleotidyltransferase component of viral defense system